MKKIIIIFVAALLPLFAGTLSRYNLSYIPSYELYQFKNISEDSKDEDLKVIVKYRVKEDSDGVEFWHIKNQMLREDRNTVETFKIRLDDLCACEWASTQEFDRGTLTQESKIENADIQTSEDNTFIASTSQMINYILRTFPFSQEADEVRIIPARQNSDRFKLYAKYKGKEILDIPLYGKVSTLHVELRVDVPVIGMFIPKINYYFLDNAQKTLVSIEGNISFEKDKNMDLRLTKYERRD